MTLDLPSTICILSGSVLSAKYYLNFSEPRRKNTFVLIFAQYLLIFSTDSFKHYSFNIL